MKSIFSRFSRQHQIWAALFIGFISCVSPAMADVYNFSFTDLSSQSLVGGGTFSFDGSAGFGTFPLSSLPNFDFNFNIGPSHFTTDELVTWPDNVAVLFSNQNVYFSGLDSSGLNDQIIEFVGPDNDALYFFTPNGNPFFAAQDSSGQEYFGTYAVAPEPGSGLMMAVLPLAFITWRFSLRRQVQKVPVRSRLRSAGVKCSIA